MVLLVSFGLCLATALGTISVFLWLESRKESVPRRLLEVVTEKKETRKRRAGAGGWTDRLRRRTRAHSPTSEDLVEMFTAREVTGPRVMLARAGYRSTRAYSTFAALRLGLPLVLGIFGLLYGKSAGLTNQAVVLLFVGGASVGIVLPILVLRMKVLKRQEQITDSLPDGLDLLVVCIEAGLGLNAAFVKITEEFRISSPVLSEEFDVVNREMVAGKPRQEALRALAERTGVEEVKSLVAMLIQTEKLGTSLSRSLRVHSDAMRTRRRQRAEEAAAKTTIKLVFPLVFLMFPALFAVILGPGVIQVIRILLPVAQR